jgi:hypothetical protein
MVFANKGDLVRTSSKTTLSIEDLKQGEDSTADYKTKIREDLKIIESTLNANFGSSTRARFGEGARMEEEVWRWDWKGHSIILAAPQEEYIAVRILPINIADRGGRAEHISDNELKQILLTRIEKRANGDVVLKDIPMVNQGPKGFCVTATWERYLRYIGIHADMYVLAMAGRTRAGGGTTDEFMAFSMQDLVNRYDRQIKRVKFPATTSNVKEYIDEGLPLMWTMFVVNEVDRDLTTRSRSRIQTGNLNDWNTSLEAIDQKQKVPSSWLRRQAITKTLGMPT